MARKVSLFEHLAYWAARWTGTSWAFALALGAILVWAITGPVFGFSDTWQLVINTSTTIITFLMVFLIQRLQNKDACAIQLKLNELVAVVHGASNRLINVEDLSEKEVESLHKHYRKLVELAKQEGQLTESHSIEEAEGRHRSKHRAKRQGREPQAKPEGRIGRSSSDAPERSYPALPAISPVEANDCSGHQENIQHQSNGLAGVGLRLNGTHAVGADEISTDEDKLAQFLHAAARLQRRIRWHQRGITEMKEALARYGFRLKILQEAPRESPGGGDPPGKGKGVGEMPSPAAQCIQTSEDFLKPPGHLPAAPIGQALQSSGGTVNRP